MTRRLRKGENDCILGRVPGLGITDNMASERRSIRKREEEREKDREREERRGKGGREEEKEITRVESKTGYNN